MRMGAACLAVVLAMASATFASDFTYTVPDGFRELRTETRPGDADESQVPPALVKDARNPQYILVAIDPSSTTREAVGASFNVVEMKTTGHMTLDTAKTGAQGIAAGFKAKGIPTTLVDVTVTPMNGVDTAVITFDLDAGGGVRRTRQYIMPGPHGSTILSYSAPRSDFEKYYPSFLRSLRATRGAGEPAPTTKFNWTEFFLAGIVGGLIGAAGFGIKKYAGKRANAADSDVSTIDEPAQKTATRRPSKHLWYCDACGKPVPLRLDQCRCGGKKPA